MEKTAKGCVSMVDPIDLTAGKADFLPLLRTLTEIPAPTGQEERRGDFCRRWLE